MTLENLLKSGYFPKELPPPFTTEKFSNHFKSKSNFESMKGKSKISEYSQFSIPKLNYIRTKVALINPFNYLVLAEIIRDNWSDIQRIFNGSVITTSLPNINGSKFNTKKTFTEFKEESLLKSLGRNVLLKTDISRFYSSVYTHSIPWAIHTKEVAKRTRDNTLYGNKLDSAVRNCQDQQTNGIPVGPITSLIISEILLCDIDKKLLDSIRTLNGKRYIDDFMLFFKSDSEAEVFFKELQFLLTDMQLEINSNKTNIQKIPYELEDKWISEISTFISTSHNLKQKNFLSKLYSKILLLVKENPNKYIIKYLIVIIEDIFIEKDSWDLFQVYLLNLTQLEPSILPNTLSIIISYHDKYKFSLNEISEFYNSLISEHIFKGNNFEVSWSLWSLLELNLNINANIGNDILRSEDWCSKLILLHMDKNGLINGQLLEKTNEQTNIHADDLYSQKWLFIYEAYFKNWLTVNAGVHPVEDDSFFKRLHKKKISFYNETSRVARIDIEGLESENLLDFTIDNSAILSAIDSMKVRITKSKKFEDIQDVYKDLLEEFENFIEDSNAEFSEHIKKTVSKGNGDY